MIGNDIVDLQFFEAPAYHHVHYLKRVCTAEEASFVRQSHDSCRTLAIFWAAKEAAYKLISRCSPACRFIPHQFITQLDNSIDLASGATFEVIYAGNRIKTAIFQSDRWVHGVATFPGTNNVRWTGREIDRCSQSSHPTERESEAARWLAQDLLLESGEKELALKFAGRVPTVVLIGNGQPAAGISLSHHGAFASAALALPSDEISSAMPNAYRLVEELTWGETCSTCTV